MKNERRILPVVAGLTGLTWMVSVLLISANHKGITASGDVAYDWSNRAHTVAVLLLLATAVTMWRILRDAKVRGEHAALALVVGAALMLAGNVLSFWGTLFTGGTSEQFWGGWAGWLVFLLGGLLTVAGFIGLALAARQWAQVSLARRWQIGSVGLFLMATTITWAGSPVATLVPALLAAFTLLSAGTTIARAQPGADHPTSTQPVAASR